MRKPGGSGSMRPGERAVVVGGVSVLVLVALWGALSAPGRDLDDHRLSTYLTGPSGAKGLMQTLRRLGVTVEQRRRPYFDVATDSGGRRSERLYAFLDIERHLPVARRVLRALPAESLSAHRSREADEGRCEPRLATRVDTLLRTVNDRALALRLRFPSGGEAILLADARFLTNRALKETDAGVTVLPWFLAGRTRQVVVDEYHLGFGAGGSLPGASWAWLRHHPPGWAILQLLGVALVALAMSAVRFGPARSVIVRRRRSPLEHVEALAAGLEGAGGVDTAVGLTVSGLRRRLGRVGLLPPGGERAWLAALELALPTTAGRNAVRRLQRTINQPGGPERALAAAQAVEDVWTELRPRTTRAGF